MSMIKEQRPRGKYEVSRSPDRERLLETLRARRDQRKTMRNLNKKRFSATGDISEIPSAIRKPKPLRLPELDQSMQRPKLMVDKMSVSVRS